MQFASTRLQKPKELRWQDRSSPWPKPAPKPDLCAKAEQSTILKAFERNCARQMSDAKNKESQQKLIAALNCNFNSLPH